MRFKNGCEKNLSLNQLTVAIADKIMAEEEPEVSTIPEIPEDNVKKQKGYYRCVYVLLQFKTEDKIDSKEEQTELENDPDEEDMDDVNIDDERERHWINVLRTMKEVWTKRRHCYMLSVGIYISTRRKYV